MIYLDSLTDDDLAEMIDPEDLPELAPVAALLRTYFHARPLPRPLLRPYPPKETL